MSVTTTYTREVGVLSTTYTSEAPGFLANPLWSASTFPWQVALPWQYLSVGTSYTNEY